MHVEAAIQRQSKREERQETWGILTLAKKENLTLAQRRGI
jgi:hypothetical protein